MKLALSHRTVMLTVSGIVLVAAGFTAGTIVGHRGLAQARASWTLERDRLQTTAQVDNRLASSLRDQEALWQLDAEVSAVLADLADRNFGRARDEVAAANSLFFKSTFPDAAAKTLAPLPSLLVDIGRSADSLSVDAIAKAEQARSLIRASIDGIVAAAGT